MRDRRKMTECCRVRHGLDSKNGFEDEDPAANGAVSAILLDAF
jgi:hypothetical protein